MTHFMRKQLKKILVVVNVLLLTTPMVMAQTAALLPNARQQYFDGQGKVLSQGSVEYNVPGTNTLKNIWLDSGESIPAQNPQSLDENGYPEQTGQIYGEGTYRQILRDKNGVVIWDNLTSSTGGGGGGGGTPTVGDGAPVGTVRIWGGFTVPNQYVLAYGQELIRTNYPEAFQALTFQQTISCTSGNATLTGFFDTTQLPIGAPIETPCLNPGATIVSKTSNTVTASSVAIITTTVSARFFPYGNGNGSTTFNVPDLKGRVVAGRDNMGGIPSNRLSFATGLGAVAGDQSYNITQSNLPNVSPTFSGTPMTASGSLPNVAVGNFATTTPGGSFSITSVTGLGSPFTTDSFTPAGTISSLNGGVSQTSMPLIQPTQAYNYIVKVLPDTNPNTFFGVASIGGMYGVIECGYGITCAGNTISAVAAIVPPPQPTVLGGVFSLSCSTSNWFHSLDTSGTFGCSQPSFSDLTGFISISQINNNAITNAKLSQVGAATIKGNPTASTANVQDFTIQGLTNLASPNATLDFLPIYDHLSGTIKNTTPQGLVGSTVAGVSSIGGMTGAINCGSNVTCSSNTIQVNPPTSNIYNVTSYGAVCDNVTDDTPAINSAIASVPSGSTLVFPATMCKVASLLGTGNPHSITINKPIHISFPNGGGINQTVSGALFNIESSYVTIDGAAGAILNGPSTNTLYDTYSVGIVTNNYFESTTLRQYVTVRGLRVTNFGAVGIMLWYCDYCTIEGNYVNNMRYAGIQCIACRFGVIDNNRVENIWSSTGPSIPPDPSNRADHYGIAVTSDGISQISKNVVVTNNVVNNVPAWECYDTHNGQNIVFANNVGLMCMVGLSVSNPASPVADPNGIVIANNRIKCAPPGSPTYEGGPGDSIGNSGIRVVGHDVTRVASEVTIKGNVISECGASDLALSGSVGSISVGYVTGISIEGNVIYLGRHRGITVTALTYGSIQNNRIDQLVEGPAASGAYLFDIVNADNKLNLGGTSAFGSGYYGYNIAAQGSGYSVSISRSNVLDGATADYVGSSASNRIDLGASPP